MAELNWDEGPRPYEVGLERGVLYSEGVAVPWNGLISLEEKEVVDLDTTYFVDGVRRRITQQSGSFSATLQAFTYPDEFAQYDGYSKDPTYNRFGLSYRTLREDEGARLHLIYNAIARPSARSMATIGDVLSPATFAWDIYTSAVDIPGARPASHLTIDLSEAGELTEAVEGILYGTATTSARLPSPAELIDLFETITTLRVTYNSDGTWTATGPDDVIQVNADGSFTLSAPTAFLLDEGVFTVTSY